VSAPTIDPAIWTEPPRGGFGEPGILGLSGLEQVQSFLEGHVPPPPISHLTGMVLTEAGPGAATFTMPATRWLLTPTGHISLGGLAMLADGPLGCAIQTTLPPATPYTTSDITMSFLRPPAADGSALVCRGRVVHAGRSLALSEAVIEGGDGRPVAHCTSRCFRLPPIDPPPQVPDPLPTVGPPAFDERDPYRRPVTGSPVPQEAWDRMSGLEVLRGFLAGELPAPPITHLTGLRVTAAEEGTCTFVLPATLWLCSPSGFVEGGAIAMLADTVLATAVQTTCPPRTAYTPLDLKVNFLRPVPPDGSELVGTGTVIHRGRTMAVATASLTNAAGKAVAVAHGTALVREGHGWGTEEEPVAPPAE
jgi:uncharacterized protein (TIGR00369 family)